MKKILVQLDSKSKFWVSDDQWSINTGDKKDWVLYNTWDRQVELKFQIRWSWNEIISKTVHTYLIVVAEGDTVLIMEEDQSMNEAGGIKEDANHCQVSFLKKFLTLTQWFRIFWNIIGKLNWFGVKEIFYIRWKLWIFI